MFKFYTADYEGEMVSDSLHWRDGNKDSNGVWIPKTILNDEHTKTAHIIGNGPSREKINLFLLDGQSGGEGGITSVGQSYGCNQTFEEFNPTFLFCVNTEILEQMVLTGYYEDNIVYTTRNNLLKFPGKFHLYPHWQKLYMGPAAMRMACADGHKRVYLIGFDFYFGEVHHLYPATDTSYLPMGNTETIRSKLLKQVCNIIKLYDDVEFFHVLNTFNNKVEHQFEEFKWLPNIKPIGLFEYTNQTGLGAVAK
jgi:hypothetical protein